MNDLIRRNKVTVGILLLVLGILVLLSVANRDSAYPTNPLHPENPDPPGARAVARVLDDRGVPVTIAHNAAELEKARVDRGTTFAVSSMEALGETTAKAMEARAAAAGAVVYLAPPPGLLGLLVTGLDDGPELAGRSKASCEDPLLSGLEVDVRPTQSYRGKDVTRCFKEGDSALVLRLEDEPTTYVVGGDVFTNKQIRKADNAAVALRLLGQRDRVVWYVPDPLDITAGDGVTVASLLPRWLVPSLVLVGAALVGLVLWRGRRLGPVAVEPLPVVVRNTEAVEARGRLYRKARDHRHAAAALRAGTVARLGRRLAVEGHALPPAVATAAGRSTAEVARLLDGEINDERALLALAHELTDLEDQVTRGEGQQ